jgi:hypothetical protein
MIHLGISNFNIENQEVSLILTQKCSGIFAFYPDLYLQSKITSATRNNKHNQGVASYNFWAFIFNASCLYSLLPFKISLHNLFHKLLVLFQSFFLNNHHETMKSLIALFFIKKDRGHSRGCLPIHVANLVLPVTFILNPVNWLVSVIKTSPPKKIFIKKKIK